MVVKNYCSVRGGVILIGCIIEVVVMFIVVYKGIRSGENVLIF